MAEAQPERNTLTLKGASASVMWGYHHAATLSGWSVGGAPGAWTLTAQILNQDAFRVSQRPLRVVTPNGWVWLVTSLQISDGRLTASIRPQES